jgi:4-amino-4-deoxy-L-arabinose transferase-like glycosyltransferase
MRLPLLAVLAVQAALSLRLVRADTAFQDEALYLWAGHREWAHWLHGMPVPPFPAYFSGAPVVYPPVGALADSVGGLAGARVLSLVFMLGATVLLWGTAGRLFGRRAAFFAAALFATAGPVLHLGAFATYDAMSVLLVALAAWCVVRAGGRQDATGWMAAAGAVLALAKPRRIRRLCSTRSWSCSRCWWRFPGPAAGPLPGARRPSWPSWRCSSRRGC